METVTEWCPFCEAEHDYRVGEKTFISKCKTCGRPILLCDKCLPENRNCGGCPLEYKVRELMEKWESDQIGRVVYWKDPDEGACSDWCRIIGFKNGAFVLAHLFYPDRCESVVVAYDSEIDFVSERKQIGVYEKFFASGNYKNGTITLDNSYRK